MSELYSRSSSGTTIFLTTAASPSSPGLARTESGGSTVTMARRRVEGLNAIASRVGERQRELNSIFAVAVLLILVVNFGDIADPRADDLSHAFHRFGEWCLTWNDVCTSPAGWSATPPFGSVVSCSRAELYFGVDAEELLERTAAHDQFVYNMTAAAANIPPSVTRGGGPSARLLCQSLATDAADVFSLAEEALFCRFRRFGGGTLVVIALIVAECLYVGLAFLPKRAIAQRKRLLGWIGLAFLQFVVCAGFSVYFFSYLSCFGGKWGIITFFIGVAVLEFVNLALLYRRTRMLNRSNLHPSTTNSGDGDFPGGDSTVGKGDGAGASSAPTSPTMMSDGSQLFTSRTTLPVASFRRNGDLEMADMASS
jgi:hypothetical protein